MSLLALAPAHAADSGPGREEAKPAAAPESAKAPPQSLQLLPDSKTAMVNSKSPYAAWRARREAAEQPDTSGHGHRAQRPEGQHRSRKLPQ